MKHEHPTICFEILFNNHIHLTCIKCNKISNHLERSIGGGFEAI